MTQQGFLIENVSVAFATDEGIKPVLIDLHLVIAPGDWLAVVGRNGSGKSTLARVLAGLSPISRGKLIRGTADTLGQAVQMIFQNPDAQIVGATVYEDVCFGLENLAVDPHDMPRRVHQALSMVGLDGLHDRPISHLSGGQKQLLCIADALAMNATTLIFDESTAMLDPQSREQVIQVVESLHQQGTTIVWVTQLMDELGYASRVVALDRGRIIFDGTPTTFFYTLDASCDAEAPCIALGFPPPYTVQVGHELLRSHVALPSYPILPHHLKQLMASLWQ